MIHIKYPMKKENEKMIWELDTYERPVQTQLNLSDPAASASVVWLFAL